MTYFERYFDLLQWCNLSSALMTKNDNLEVMEIIPDALLCVKGLTCTYRSEAIRGIAAA